MRNWFMAWLLLGLAGTAMAVPEGPEYPSPQWSEREEANYAKTLEAPSEQAGSPAFVQRWQEQSLLNLQSYLERGAADSSWNLSPASNSPITPQCASWMQVCTGDPFRYPGVDPFYDTLGVVQPFVYYDEACARISGRVWKPVDARTGLPAVIIESGSVQSPEPLYWWAAQLLVRNGYTVMTFDPRGQGRSDQQGPNGEQGGNNDPTVFWDGLVNAIDFFRSTPVQPYPHNETCAGTYPTEVAAYNPFHMMVDPERLGLAGHSLGAAGVTIVQGYGAPGADPWPGLIDPQNPVDVIVAWDGLRDPNATGFESEGVPIIVPRVPAMGHSAEYGFTPTPFLQPPEPDAHKGAYAVWQAAGKPVYQLTIQGSTHFDWSLIPSFPATSWCPEVVDGRCTGGWGLPLAEYYTLAWFDRWLKLPDEKGYASADARLTADVDWADRLSFYHRSARDFPARQGTQLHCEDIRGGIIDDQPCHSVRNAAGGASGKQGAASGGCTLAGEPAEFDPVLALLVLIALLGISRRHAINHDGQDGPGV